MMFLCSYLPASSLSSVFGALLNRAHNRALVFQAQDGANCCPVSCLLWAQNDQPQLCKAAAVVLVFFFFFFFLMFLKGA